MREEAAAASPLVPVIEALLGRPDGSGAEGFDGTATELLDKLKKICTEAQQKARWFPSSASAAGTHLRRIAPLLRGARDRGRHVQNDRARSRAANEDLLQLWRCLSCAASAVRQRR